MMESYLSRINGPEDLKTLPAEKLPALAAEIRELVKDVIATNGGHLGSNLGAVEFTVALHRSFDFANDRLIWDVSHQCYTHKILSGRKDRFDTIRQHKGLSGFTNKDESAHDPFTMGHAGMAVSTALGIACADALTGDHRYVVAVLGDGAMTCGSTYEALNNCGALRKNVIVILNDNNMSISKTVGAMADYLSKVRIAPAYHSAKKEIQVILEKMPLIGQPIEKTIDQLRSAIKTTLGGIFFETLGFHYYGPFDGHNIENLIKVFGDVKKLKGPILVHLVTEKGKGCEIAERDPFKMHGISPATATDPKVISASSKPKTNYTDVFARAIVNAAQRDQKVVAITAAMPDGTGLVEFEREFPMRFFDVGICEQHAIGLAGGLATGGMKPVVAIYSTFLQRGLDQVFEEVCLQRLPVVFAIDRAGLVGNDGPTHHGVYDIAILRQFPNLQLLAPRDGAELARMLEYALAQDCACAIRYPRSSVPEDDAMAQPPAPLKKGKAEVLRTGTDGAIIAYGTTAHCACLAADALKDTGISVTVVNARFAKPLDEELIEDTMRKHPFTLVTEEHSMIGGFGSAVAELAARRNIPMRNFHALGIPDSFIPHGDRHMLLDQFSLTSDGIFRYILRNILKDEKSYLKGK